MSLDIAAELPRQQAVLYAALVGGKDVRIQDLFTLLVGPPTADIKAWRCGQQQYVGPYLTKLNRRLAKHRLAVKPGVARASYRLVNL